MNPFEPYGHWHAFGVPHDTLLASRCSGLSSEIIQQLIAASSRRHGLDVDLVNAMIQQESGFQPCVVSSRGAQGLMQLMPGTARDLGVTNPLDARQNIAAGTRLLQILLARYDGDLAKALAAYNAGPRPVDRAAGVPPIPQTHRYVERVLRGTRRPHRRHSPRRESGMLSTSTSTAAGAP
jgi:soluble lytic murein transglycosylase-like protein